MRLVTLALACVLLASSGFFSGCVSKKKYTDLQADYDSLVQDELKRTATVGLLMMDVEELEGTITQLEADTTRLGEEIRNLEYQLGSYMAASASEKEALSEELQEKQQTLALREQQLMRLQEVLSRQQRQAQQLRNRIQAALANFTSDQLTVENRNGRVYVSLSEKLLFESGRTEVDPQGKEALQTLSNVLQRNPDIEVLVEGHTDTVPIKTARFKDNWDLSVQRATSITRLLTDYGVSPKRITAAGRGEYFPVAPNTTSEGRARNRRTEIILLPDLSELYSAIRNSEE